MSQQWFSVEPHQVGADRAVAHVPVLPVWVSKCTGGCALSADTKSLPNPEPPKTWQGVAHAGLLPLLLRGRR